MPTFIEASAVCQAVGEPRPVYHGSIGGLIGGTRGRHVGPTFSEERIVGTKKKVFLVAMVDCSMSMAATGLHHGNAAMPAA